MLQRFDDGILLLTRLAVVALLFVMFASTLAGVFFRYVLNDALTWSEEAARYSMVWLSLLGSGLIFREAGHVAVEMLVAQLPWRGLRIAVMVLAQVAVITVLLVLVWQGMVLVGRGQYMTTPALRLPMYLPYAALPVGAALMIYHVLVAGILKCGAASGDSPPEPQN